MSRAYRGPFLDVAKALVTGPRDPQRPLRAHIIEDVERALQRAYDRGRSKGWAEGRQQACASLRHLLQTADRQVQQMRNDLNEIEKGPKQ